MTDIEVMEVPAEDVPLNHTVYLVVTWYDTLGWGGGCTYDNLESAMQAARQYVAGGRKARVLKIEVPDDRPG